MSISTSRAAGDELRTGIFTQSGYQTRDPTAWKVVLPSRVVKMAAHINSRIRQVRLRPEFAHLYPGLDPGVWETATDLAARLLAQHVMQPSPGYMLTNRMLPDEHFEFQGGAPRSASWTGLRSRLTDQSSRL
jgi:hypothetical protein